PPSPAAQDQVAMAISGRADDARPSRLIHTEKTVRQRGRLDRIDRHLEPAVRAVLETDRRGKTARHLAVRLRLGRARPDRVPRNQLRKILRADRVERLGGRWQSYFGELHEQLARAQDPFVDAE